jgi:bifunctional non-homologous end joining protein LigD
MQEKPFANKTGREREAVWVRPEITVKIQYAEWTEGHSLRQPSIQAFVDIPPTECVFGQ